MALSFMEMRGLQKQAAAIKDELKSGTLAFMDMRKKQRELAEIIAKIKGETPNPAPGQEDEEGTDADAEAVAKRSLVGLFLGGVIHPAWVKVYEKSAKANAIVSNEELGVVILWQAEQGTKRDAFQIGWPVWNATITQGADDAWAGVKSSFPAAKRKKVRYMVEQAMKAAKDAMSNGVGKYAIYPGGYPGHVDLGYSDGSVRVTGMATLAPALTDAFAKLRYAHAPGLTGVSAVIAEGETAAALNLLGVEITTADMGRGAGLSMAEFEQLIQTIPAEDQGRYSHIIDSLRQKVAALPGNQGEPAPQPEPDPSPATGQTLIERYQAGEFNGEDYPQFRQRVLEVEAAGADFETLRDGVIAWAEANHQLFNDAA